MIMTSKYNNTTNEATQGYGAVWRLCSSNIVLMFTIILHIELQRHKYYLIKQ